MSEKKENFLLPQELHIQILLDLPVKSLLRFKIVSKNWHSLIGSSSFTTRYSRISCERDRDKILCFRKDPIAKSFLVSVLSNNSTQEIVDLEWPPFLDEGIENKEDFDRGISVLGPVNGIYCIFNRLIERWAGTLVLWNPATKEYKHIFPPIVLPIPSQLVAGKWNPNDDDFFHWRRPLGLSIGFGYDYNTNDYKLVVLSHWIINYGPEDDRWHVRIYNLSTDSWRTIYYLTLYNDVLPPFEGQYPPFPTVDTYPDYPHCLLNGVFHWSCCEGVLAFDFSNESFQLMKGPSLDEYYNCVSVWVVKETLAMIFSSINLGENPSNTVEVWMMMKYGVEDTWAKLHSFGPIDGLCPIGIPNDYQIFFCDDKIRLISSGFEDHEIKEYGIYGAPEFENTPTVHKSLGVVKYVETIENLKRICE